MRSFWFSSARRRAGVGLIALLLCGAAARAAAVAPAVYEFSRFPLGASLSFSNVSGTLRLQKHPDTDNYEVLFQPPATGDSLWLTGSMNGEDAANTVLEMKWRANGWGAYEQWPEINWYLRRRAWNTYYMVKFHSAAGTFSIRKATDDGSGGRTESILPMADQSGPAKLQLLAALAAGTDYHTMKLTIYGGSDEGTTIRMIVDNTIVLTAFDAADCIEKGQSGMSVYGQEVYFDDLYRYASTGPIGTWHPMDTQVNRKKDSALDLSAINDAPSGKHGFLRIDANGNFYFEDRPGETVRFYGTNINGSYYIEPTHEQTDKIVERLAASGYNLVRFSAVDQFNDWARGLFELPRSTQIALLPQKLDSFEYLVSKLKEKGIYIDLEIMSYIPFSGIPALSAYQAPQAALAMVTPEGRAAFESMARGLLTHINPYTGLALKDDPVLVNLSPWNEHLFPIMNLHGNPATAALFLADFNAYLGIIGKPPATAFPAGVWDANQNNTGYYAYRTMKSYGEMRDFLKNEIGVKAPIGGLNILNDTMSNYYRTQADIQDMHLYNNIVDGGLGRSFVYTPKRHLPYSITFSRLHEDIFYNEIKFANTQFNNYIPAMAVGQIYQKPFALTEFTQEFPTEGRDELGMISAAYGAFNGWDLFARFDFGGNVKSMLSEVPLGGSTFSTISDPLVTASEHQSTLLFRQGGIVEAAPRFVMVISKAFAAHRDSVFHGAANRNLAYIPHLFKMVSVYADLPELAFYIYKISPDTTPEQIRTGNLPARDRLLSFTQANEYLKYTMSNKQIAQTLIQAIDDEPLRTRTQTALDAGILRSETGQLTFDTEKCRFMLETPVAMAAAGSFAGETAVLEGGSLYATVDDGTLSVSAMDGAPLRQSRHMLAIYTTDTSSVGENILMGDTKNERVYHRGSLPTLIREEQARITLKTDLDPRGYRAYRLDVNGNRLSSLPVVCSDGEVTVLLKTDRGFYFEIDYAPLVFWAGEQEISRMAQLQPGDTVTVRASVWPPGDGAALILAYYQGGMLTQMRMAAAEEAQSGALSLKLPQGPLAGGRIKAFVWQTVPDGNIPCAYGALQ